MENAVKALYIAAGVLIGIMILSLGAIIYSNLQNYVETSKEEIRFNELTRFNNQFENYINYENGEKKFDLTIQDIITVAGIAHEQNSSYNPDSSSWGNPDPDSLYVAIFLDGRRIDTNIKEKMEELLTEESKKTYKCENTDINYSNSTGRIFSVNFSKE